MSVTNQQWVQAKGPNDVTLEGVDIELDWDGSTINSILVRDPNGHVLRIIKGEYSGMRAMVPATSEKFRLHGVALGINVNQIFDNDGAAEDRKNAILAYDERAKLTVEKVRVPA